MACYDNGNYNFAKLFHQSTKLKFSTVYADGESELQRAAGGLLLALWHVQPSLVADFASNKHVSPILKRLAAFTTLTEGMLHLQLVQGVWSFTAALAAEPLLVKAIPRLVQVCEDLVASGSDDVHENDRQLANDIQVC